MISDGIFWDLNGVTLVEEDTNFERAGHVNNDFVDVDAWCADACTDIYVDIQKCMITFNFARFGSDVPWGKNKKPTNCLLTEAPPRSAPKWNIAKGTMDPRVEFISQVFAQILIKFQIQNLELALTSKSQPNISISTKCNRYVVKPADEFDALCQL